MNTVQRMFYVALGERSDRNLDVLMDSSPITPEMVCGCDMNKKLTARTNAFSKVLDSD